jgi:hypothetical protein
MTKKANAYPDLPILCDLPMAAGQGLQRLVRSGGRKSSPAGDEIFGKNRHMFLASDGKS